MPSVDKDLESALQEIRDTRVRWRLLDMLDDAIRRLDLGEVDVVVLAARRMACLYSLLAASGLRSPTSGVILADRFLELAVDADAWAGRRVLILDDTRRTGRTVADRIERMRRLVGPTGRVEVDVVVIADNVELSAEDPEIPRSTPVRLSEAELADLSRDFARVFGQGLMPYFTDFPVSKEITITIERLEELLNSDDWLTVDVTNAAIAGSENRTYSLLPRGMLLDDLRSSLGAAAELLEICKVRLFTSDGGLDVRLKAVPVVSFGALDRSSLENANRAMGGSLSEVWQWVGLATYAIARVVLKEFADHAMPIVEQAFSEDEAITDINLGPAVRDRLSAEFGSLEPLALVARANSGTISATEQELQWGGKLIDDQASLLVWGDDLVAPVFDPVHALLVEEPEDPRWSERAVELHSLADQLGANTTTTSLAVDVLNDLGNTVPCYYEREGVVYRGYRPGEASFGFGELSTGRLGGRLASVAETIRVGDPREVDDVSLVLNHVA